MLRWMCAFALLALAGAATAAEPVTVPLDEWKVPWDDSRPRDPFAQSADKVWFVGQRGNYVGLLNSKDGTFKKFDLPEKALPHNVIVDEKGIAWYAGNGDAHIGRIDPATGKIERIDMPDKDARDPHTLVSDGAGNIWFTVQAGNMVGRLVTATRDVKLIKMPSNGSRPYGIKIAKDGRPWVVEFGWNKLAVIDPQTFTVKEIEIPRKDARPRRIEITSDGVIWYVDYAKGFLGSYDPKTEKFQEWAAPGGTGSQPYGLVADDQNNLWFLEFGSKPARFVGFNTRTKNFMGITDIPSGGGVRHMHFHAPTRTVWFGTDSNTIGKIEVPLTAPLTN
jgi:virginiamycin B lyase